MRRIAIPLLHDHHSHPLFYSAFQSGVSLESVATKAQANDLIVDRSKSTDDEIVLVCSWHSERYQWSSEELESLPAVVIFNVSLHSLLINTAGRQILHSKYGDVIHQLDDRDWYEANLRTVLNWFANLNASVPGLQSYFDHLLQLGVASVEELLLVDGQEIELFDRAGLSDRTKFWASPDTFDSLSDSAQSRIAGLKLFTDGAIGARTAALSRPYLDGEPNNFGMLIYSDAQFGQIVSSCFERVPGLAVHAIGDRAIEQVLLTAEGLGESFLKDKQIRIEHAQLISQAQAIRAKRLGICLSMQPNFSIDSANYTDRMDATSCEANNPFRMLIDQVGFAPGDDLIFGSDGMPHGIEFALQQSLFPPFASQRLTVDELLAGSKSDFGNGSVELVIDDSERAIKIADVKASF